MRPHIILPTEANVRFHRRMIALMIAIALLMSGIVWWVLSTGGGGGGNRGPLGLVVAGILFVGGIAFLRQLTARLASQLRRLASHGRRYAAERVRTDLMRRGKMTHWHVVVADWRDEHGKTHEALSDPFDYDPTVLLNHARMQVLADRFEPALCLIEAEGLPPTKWRRLEAAQRARVAAHGPAPSALLVWLRRGLILIMVGALGWTVLKLVAIKMGWAGF